MNTDWRVVFHGTLVAVMIDLSEPDASSDDESGIGVISFLLSGYSECAKNLSSEYTYDVILQT